MTHASLLKLLLPPSAIDPGAPVISAELAAEGAALDTATASGDVLIDEADPRTTVELLADWERVAALPDACVVAYGTTQTTAQRRAALVARLTSVGGQSAAYFVALAAALGYTVTITEHRTFTVRSRVNDPLNNTPWRFTFTVASPRTTVRRFTVRSPVNEPLASWGNELLECAISRLKPAHTHVLFAYS